MWPLLASAGFSFVQGQLQSKALAQQSIAQNKAIMQANELNQAKTGYQLGLLRVQRGQQLQDLAQRMTDLGTQELSVLGSAINNASASGTGGASVDAVQTDYQMQFNRARAQIQQENENQAYNFNANLTTLLQNATESLYQPERPNIPSTKQNLVGSIVGTGSKYAMSRFNLGI